MTLRRNISRLALGALLIATLLAGLAPAAAQESRLVWSAVRGVPEDVTLQSVFMLDASSAWAAGHNRQGDRGYVYRLALEGGRWQVRLDAELSRPLYAVVAAGAEQAIVAGDGGFIARRDAAGGWSSEGPGAETTILRALQVFEGGRAGWALGAANDAALGTSRAVALRYADGRWSEASIQRPEGNSYVTAVHLAAGGGWAVGSHIWRLDGNSWRLEEMPELCADPSCALSLAGVRAVDGERAWAVGARHASCAICTTQSVVGARGPAGWGNPFPGQRVLDAAGAQQYG